MDLETAIHVGRLAKGHREHQRRLMEIREFPQPEVTASVALHVELNVGAPIAAPAPAAPVVLRQPILIVPTVRRTWRTCPAIPPLLADDATQDQETVWALHNRAVAAACKRNLATVDGLLTKAEATAKKAPR